MTDRRTSNEPSLKGSKMVDKDDPSDRKDQIRDASKFKKIKTVKTKRDDLEEHRSSVPREGNDETRTSSERGKSGDVNMGRIIFENIEDEVREARKTSNKRPTLSFANDATVVESTIDLERLRRLAEGVESSEDNLAERSEEYPSKDFFYHCLVHLTAYVTCSVIMILTIVAGYWTTKRHLRNCHFHQVLWEIWAMNISRMADGFRYTKNTGFLTHAQRLFYEKNGYLLFPKLISQDILDKCHKRFDDIVSGKVERNMIIVMRDVKDRNSVNKIQDINHDKVFREYTENKILLDVVENFTGPNIMAMHSMLIAKPPDIGYGTTKHPPHQDLYYFPFRPADKIVAAWTAMEKCDSENGCLYVAPGSHRHDKLYRHDYPPNVESNAVNKFYYGIVDLPKTIDWLELEMEPGDTVFFHPLIIHGSGVNRSTRTRRAISCHYASANCHYLGVEDIETTRIHEEIMDHVKKRFPGVSIKYTDIWHIKSSLVRGFKSTL